MLKFHLELNQNFFMAEGQSQTIYGLIRIRPEENAIKGRALLDIKFLLDRSGSMSDRVSNINMDINTIMDFLFSKKKSKNLTKLDLLKIAVNQFIDRMGLNDMISIITFDSRAKEVVSTVIKKEKDKNDIKKIVKQIRTGGSTNMSEALNIALNGSDTVNNVKRIIIFTDGDVNSPSVKEEEKACIELAGKAKKLKIPFTVFG
ncbi:MAG: VWA domain-containing protein, partial [Candidatus Eremiobacterota bacterium]